MQQESQAKPLAPPGTQDSQRIDPGGHTIRTERASGNLVARICDKPERGIEICSLDLAMPPLVEVARHMAPVVAEHGVHQLENRTGVALRHKGTQDHALRPRWSLGSRLHLDLHAPVPANFLKTHPRITRQRISISGRRPGVQAHAYPWFGLSHPLARPRLAQLKQIVAGTGA